MDLESLFARALGIEDPWMITGVHFDSEQKRLEIRVDFKKGATFQDNDGKAYKAYDTVQKTWRHLNFFEHECYIIARTPRIKPESGGIKLIMPPWSGVVAGFTMLFEALVIRLCTDMPVHKVGQMLGLHDGRLWRMLDAYVFKGQLQSDFSDVRQIGVDETSCKKGHDYISLFVDLKKRRTIHISDGKGHQTFHHFAEDFESFSGDLEKITDISCDMSPAFIKGASEVCPNAQITFDKFHILKIINEAVDQVRRQEAKTHAVLKGARFAILKNKPNLTKKQQETREKLSQHNLKTMKAIHIREGFQEIYKADSYETFKGKLQEWYFWATHSQIEPIKTAAKTIKKHWNGILRWKESQINNGILEGLNSIIQAAKRKARGYKKMHFKTMALLLTSGFNFKCINPFLPTHFR